MATINTYQRLNCESNASEGRRIPSLNVPLPDGFVISDENLCPAVVLISQKWPTKPEAAAARSRRLKCMLHIWQNALWETTAGRLTKFSSTFHSTADRLILRVNCLNFIQSCWNMSCLECAYLCTWEARQRPLSYFQAKAPKESLNQQIKQYVKSKELCCMSAACW